MSLSVRSIDQLPESGWGLPHDTIYMSIGCIGCENSICFAASSIKSYGSAESKELREVVSLAGAYADVHRGFETISNSHDCIDGCAHEEDIKETKEIIEEMYNTSLQEGEA